MGAVGLTSTALMRQVAHLMAFMPHKSFVSVGARLQQSSPVFVDCSRGEERGGCIWGEARGESSVRCLLNTSLQLIGHEILSLGGSNPPDDPRTSTTVTWRGRVPYTQGLFSLNSGCLGLGGNPSELALTGACYQVDTHGSYTNWKQPTD